MALDSLNVKTIRLGSCLYDQWLKEKGLFEEQLNAVRYDGDLLSSEVSAGDFLDHLLDLHRRICRVCRSPVNPRSDLSTQQLIELRSRQTHGSRSSGRSACHLHDIRLPTNLHSQRSQSSKIAEVSGGCEDSATESHTEIITEETLLVANNRAEQVNTIVIEDVEEVVTVSAGDSIKTEVTRSQELNKERSCQSDFNRSRTPPQNPGGSQICGTVQMSSDDGTPPDGQSAGQWNPPAVQDQDQMTNEADQPATLLPSQDNQSFSCWDCGQRFDSMENLQEHCLQGNCHQQRDLMDLYREKLSSLPHGEEEGGLGRSFGPEPTQDLAGSGQQSVRGDAPRQGLSCMFCSKVFSNKTSLGIHMKVHQPAEAHGRLVASKNYPRRENQERHAAIPAGYQRFSCLACKQKFKYRNSLEVHILTIHGDPQYASGTQAIGVQEQSNPNTPMTSQMGQGVEAQSIGTLAETDRFQCPEDGCQLPAIRQYSQPSLSMGSLLQARLDKRLQKHICSICHKIFSQSNNLKRHMRIHTNEKPYKCDVCLRGFAQSNTLKEHMHIHSNHKGYSCSACGKRFRQRSSIDKHKKINSAHGVVECSLCGQRFAHKCTLRSHMASHMAF